MRLPKMLAAGLAVLLISAANVRAQAAPRVLGSAFYEWASLSFKPTPVGLYAPICDAPTPALERLEIHVTRLRPGVASHPPHHHPWEEILLVKEGSLEVSINGRTQPAESGSMIFLASNDVHNVTNVGASLATYYVINFHTAAEHSVRDRPAAEWAPDGLLRSCVVDCNRIAASVTRLGTHASLVSSPTLTFRVLESHITSLGPGQVTTPRNRIAGDELFVVRAGSVETTLNGVTRTLGPGSLFYVAPNDERTMRNTGAAPCSYQVIRVESDRTPRA